MLYNSKTQILIDTDFNLISRLVCFYVHLF